MNSLMAKFRLKLNKAGKRLIWFCQENALVIAKPASNNTREDSTHGHYQMVKIGMAKYIFLGTKHAEGHGNPLQYSCLENPLDGRTWQATVHGVARVRHD